MTTKPIFSVGEQVIRHAPVFTQHNGEYVVLGIISSEEYEALHPMVVFTNTIPGEYFYELEGFGVKLRDGSISKHTAESFLRKKHQGSEFSFTELMDVLKLPQQV